MKEIKHYTAKEARAKTKLFNLDEAMKQIEDDAESGRNKTFVHPSILVDENLTVELFKLGYKVSYFTDQFLGEKGLLIEW
ncbi:hypothetical protein ORI89_18760 [Sphingobacterium sp. UT-1RO-CII-1]|uniref:hypothetical protein n=1 Tax=Sphingobacterium sp. UT-1RO-CII-1 TaxID=2995225 RepID=UPI00227C4C80|nr:hypothetical protein [Sphingobacterium sp. UT-1RO-CII-1]MCY4781699.1 hypothetical protein [Sphingobacterium sp. UT-1RO-CII-1]